MRLVTVSVASKETGIDIMCIRKYIKNGNIYTYSHPVKIKCRLVDVDEIISKIDQLRGSNFSTRSISSDKISLNYGSLIERIHAVN